MFSVFTFCVCEVSKSEFCVAATEIRCQEKSKGGLSYEVILAEPLAVTPPRRASSSNNKVSVENIEEKLKAAEERRLVRFLCTKPVEHRGTTVQICTLRMYARSVVQVLYCSWIVSVRLSNMGAAEPVGSTLLMPKPTLDMIVS
jgi:acetamidase/formamidase